jgi:hypothetical protein
LGLPTKIKGAMADLAAPGSPARQYAAITLARADVSKSRSICVISTSTWLLHSKGEVVYELRHWGDLRLLRAVPTN